MSKRASRSRRRHRKNYNEPGHAHELTFSCYKRFKFLEAERTCNWLVESLEDARKTLDFDIWAYVFMPEHVHVLVHPRKPVYEIEDVRAAIKEPVARKAIRYLGLKAPQWLPRITRRRGDRVERLFWQSGGGYDRNANEPATLLKMIDYLHMNPVRRGLVERAIDWRYSSAAWYEGGLVVPLIPDPIPPEWLAGL